MRRREFIMLLSGAAGICGIRTGCRASGSTWSDASNWDVVTPGSTIKVGISRRVREGLADFGYVEEQILIVEHRFPADRNRDRAHPALKCRRRGQIGAEPVPPPVRLRESPAAKATSSRS